MNIQSPTVLVVDDDEILLGTLKRVLRKEPFDLLVARSGEQALELLETNGVAVAVCDERMPTRQGRPLLQHLAAGHPDTIRISLTAAAGGQPPSGGQVYRTVAKPVEAIRLAETIKEGIAFRHQLMARELWDAGSNLPNERALLEYMDGVLSVQPNPSQHVLFLFGIDRLRDFEAFMHPSAQDSVFRSIGERLLEESDGTIDLIPSDVSIDFFNPDAYERLKRRSVFVARPGFNEFAVVFEPAGACEPAKVAAALLRALEGAFNVEGQAVFLGGRCGVVSDVAAHDNAYGALVCARAALTKARSRTSRNRIEVSNEVGRGGEAVLRGNIESDFQEAVESGLLDVYFQPLVNAVDGGVIGAEALLRWHHPHQGWMNPRQILDIADQRGLMHRLTMQVLGTACRQQVTWRDRGRSLLMSVNVACSECDHSKFVPHVLRAVERAQMSPASLQLEVSEQLLLQDPDRRLAALNQLRSMGIRLALDDFGIGLSSLSFLQQLRPDVLKLDREFVRRARRDPETASVLEAVVQMAGGLGVEVVGEGVESVDDMNYLADLGVSALQGYLFGRATRATSLEPLLFDTGDSSDGDDQAAVCAAARSHHRGSDSVSDADSANRSSSRSST